MSDNETKKQPKAKKKEFDRRRVRPVMFTDAEWGLVKELSELRRIKSGLRVMTFSSFIRALVMEEQARVS